ncbi:hypothetical protein NPX13_g1769 [Xylaria arbuscula]|uniref:tRNA (guanine(26)-N(2))-dimethyltransferase n=1 Tax=Xylaria arbuscula TaxID=114810 RepID=A0A9W8TR02_9PEZI|nr:hypothetical protein NPX13_g1769 [Xylaria arbuscula]
MFRALPHAALRLPFGHVSRVLILSEKTAHRAAHSMATKPQDGSTATTTTTTGVEPFIRDGEEYTEVKEGLASILVPFSKPDPSKKDSKSVEEQQRVFYNPIQQFNRDLTVLAIKAYAQDVLSKPRSANAKHIAKRKRDRSDIDGPNPKKRHDQPGKPADQSTADVTESVEIDASKPEETEVPTSSIKESAGKGGQSNQETNSVSDAAQLKPAQEEEPRSENTARHNAPHPPSFTILDALSATGLRALRYVRELPFVTSVTANDLSPSAVEAIRRNAEHNGVESKIVATSGDARSHMYSILAEEAPRDHEKDKYSKKNKSKSKRYNVIDLDPYGTAAPFLDAAVNAIRDDGGLLCVTCTDSGVWASNGYPEKAFSLYGGVPIKGFHSHEVGLRLILHSIATSAARYGLAIEPLLSLSIDYYIRVFVKVRRAPAQVKFLAGKTMLMYSCDHGCGAWETQLLARNKKATNKSGVGTFYKHGCAIAPTAGMNCQHCGSKTHLAGPMYAGPLHSVDFIKKILDDLPSASNDIYGTKPRIEGMLQTALEEALPLPDHLVPQSKEDEFAMIEPYPFYFHPTQLAGGMRCVCPDDDSLRGGLRSLGYEVTRSHCKSGSIKTNAPWSAVWHVMREWVRQKRPVKVENIKENSATYRLLRLGNTENDDVEMDKREVVFDQRLGRDKSKPGLVRYQMNPTENWGPMTRAKKQ